MSLYQNMICDGSTLGERHVIIKLIIPNKDGSICI